MNEQIESLLNMISDLKMEISLLQDRVADLEGQQRREQDRAGYAAEGPRYSGKHPRSCACDRCLSREFGRS